MVYNLFNLLCLRPTLTLLFVLKKVLSQLISSFQKQPFRVVLRKGCSENMQQTYGRTPCKSDDDDDDDNDDDVMFQKMLCSELFCKIRRNTCDPHLV